jgi:hypothetical protein
MTIISILLESAIAFIILFQELSSIFEDDGVLFKVFDSLSTNRPNDSL